MKFLKPLLIFVMVFLIASGPAIAKKSKPLTPIALCKDGTYSFSQTRKGTCSHHKGVKVWYK